MSFAFDQDRPTSNEQRLEVRPGRAYAPPPSVSQPLQTERRSAADGARWQLICSLVPRYAPRLARSRLARSGVGLVHCIACSLARLPALLALPQPVTGPNVFLSFSIISCLFACTSFCPALSPFAGSAAAPRRRSKRTDGWTGGRTEGPLGCVPADRRWSLCVRRAYLHREQKNARSGTGAF
jgi:hypothetical protein